MTHTDRTHPGYDFIGRSRRVEAALYAAGWALHLLANVDSQHRPELRELADDADTLHEMLTRFQELFSRLTL